MIQKVVVRNFRSLAKVELGLGRLTALVGPNGAGKTSLLQVLRLVSDAMHRSLEDAIAEHSGVVSVRRWTADQPQPIQVRVEVENDAGHGHWAFELSSDQPIPEVLAEEAAWSILDPNVLAQLPRPNFGDTSAWDPRWKGALLGNPRARRDGRQPVLPTIFKSAAPHPDFFLSRHPSSIMLKGLVDELASIQIYRIAPDGLRMPSLVSRPFPLDPRGANWASTLQALVKDSEGQDFIGAMHRVVGDISDYRVTEWNGRLAVQFRHGRDEPACWFSMDRESDGTLRTAALITALLQNPAPRLIGLEEPELYVHPGALPLVFDLLKQATRQSQVVLTTHSPDLMDLVDPDDLRIVERVNGLTNVGSVEPRQRQLVKDKLLGIGDLLHAEGLHGEIAANGQG